MSVPRGRDLLLTHRARTNRGVGASCPSSSISSRRCAAWSTGKSSSSGGPDKELDPREEVYFRIGASTRPRVALRFGDAVGGAIVGGASPGRGHGPGVSSAARVGDALQLEDDDHAYSGDPGATGKALLGDLAEGKLTLPLIRALAARPSLRSDVDAVRSGDAHAAPRIAEAVRAAGVCDGVRAQAREETSKALAALEAVPAGGARDLLGAIARELATRAA